MFNQIDTLSELQLAELKNDLTHANKMNPQRPMFFISAKTTAGVDNLIKQLAQQF